MKIGDVVSGPCLDLLISSIPEGAVWQWIFCVGGMDAKILEGDRTPTQGPMRSWVIGRGVVVCTGKKPVGLFRITKEDYALVYVEKSE